MRAACGRPFCDWVFVTEMQIATADRELADIDGHVTTCEEPLTSNRRAPLRSPLLRQHELAVQRSYQAETVS